MLFQGWKISCNSTFSLVSYDSTGSNSLIGDLRLSSYWVISEGFYRKHPYITSLRQNHPNVLRFPDNVLMMEASQKWIDHNETPTGWIRDDTHYMWDKDLVKFLLYIGLC